MTAIDLAVMQIVSGAEHLPADEQNRVISALKTIRDVFGNTDGRSDEFKTGVSLLEKGFMGLLKSIGTSILSKGGTDRQMAAIWKSLGDNYPQFADRLR